MMDTRIALRAQKSQHGGQQNLAMNFRRFVKGHIPRSTIRGNEQEATDNTKHGIRSAEGDERKIQSR